MYYSIKFIVLCAPFPLPSFLYLIFSIAKDNHKSNEGRYSPESNQSRKRTSSPGVFSWQRELTYGEQAKKLSKLAQKREEATGPGWGMVRKVF